MRKKRGPHSEEHKRKIAAALTGKKKVFSAQAIENIRKAAFKRRGILKGSLPDSVKEKIRKSTTGKKKNRIKENAGEFKKGHIPSHGFGKDHIPWNKGIPMPREIVQKVAEKLRKNGKGRWTFNYRQWRNAVFERDGQKCTKCGCAKKLHAHHIEPWEKNEMLRFIICNGITLCHSCHAKEDGFKHGFDARRRRKKSSVGNLTVV